MVQINGMIDIINQRKIHMHLKQKSKQISDIKNKEEILIMGISI